MKDDFSSVSKNPPEVDETEKNGASMKSASNK